MSRKLGRLPPVTRRTLAAQGTIREEEARVEDPVVRQYRFLLRTAPVDALEAGHREALTALEPHDREAVLTAVQTALVAGLRLGPDDYAAIAHLVVAGEGRVPGALLGSYPPAVLERMARLVIDSEAAFGLFGGYATWDGAEPTYDPGADDSAYAEHWHQAHDTPTKYRGLDGSQASPESFLGY